MTKPSKDDTQEVIPTIRTSEGMRDLLFDELDAIRSGKSNPGRAQAVSRLAAQIISSVNMEIEFHKNVRAAQRAGETICTTLNLGVAGDA